MASSLLTADSLDQPPWVVATKLLHDQLGEAREALERLHREQARPGSEPEAVHDLRVALRRMRAIARAWQGVLGRARIKKLRRRLAKLQRRLASARDVEVACTWIEGLEKVEGAGTPAVLERLRTKRHDAIHRHASRFPSDLRRLRRWLKKKLADPKLSAPGAPASSAAWLADSLAEHVKDLTQRLQAIDGPTDNASCHQARISGKRLRYLLEPWRHALKGVPALHILSKDLQNVLGEIQDAHVLEAMLEDLRTSSSSAPIPDFATTLDALLHRNQDRARSLFRHLHEHWLGSRRDQWHDLAKVVLDSIQLPRDRHADLEIERKFLLRAMPDLCTQNVVAVHEIDQLYVPGQRFHERFRRSRRGDVTTYRRTLKVGTGVERLEVEEDTTAELFDALFALPTCRRVRKRRHVVQTKTHHFEIDEFLDRDLVLMEVELKHADEDPRIPEWLEALIVREVTDENAYTNLQLAWGGGD